MILEILELKPLLSLMRKLRHRECDGPGPRRLTPPVSAEPSHPFWHEALPTCTLGTVSSSSPSGSPVSPFSLLLPTRSPSLSSTAPRVHSQAIGSCSPSSQVLSCSPILIPPQCFLLVILALLVLAAPPHQAPHPTAPTPASVLIQTLPLIPGGVFLLLPQGWAGVKALFPGHGLHSAVSSYHIRILLVKVTLLSHQVRASLSPSLSQRAHATCPT